MRKTHKDLEFQVSAKGTDDRTFKKFDEAAGFALTLAASGREGVVLDTLVWSEGAAGAWGGDAAANRYRENPDDSVFGRLEIKVNYAGSVP